MKHQHVDELDTETQACGGWMVTLGLDHAATSQSGAHKETLEGVSDFVPPAPAMTADRGDFLGPLTDLGRENQGDLLGPLTDLGRENQGDFV